MRVLVTGGCGFIGSHQVVELIAAGHEVTVVDDLSNSRDDVIERIEFISGSRPTMARLDVRDTSALTEVMVGSGCEALIHFAARKNVRESVERPIEYYRVNLDGLASVIEAATMASVDRMIFSSSGSVYGPADRLPIPESTPHRPTNPYSMTKSVGERMLRDQCRSGGRQRVVALRYFNPAGAHPSGLLGDDPTGPVSNLLPLLMRAAAGLVPSVAVFGDDYPTPDGTCVRDYVHVLDVARAHLLALDLLDGRPGFEAINIGRGQGVSVRQLHRAAEAATGRSIPIHVEARRPGDVAALHADTTRARHRLGMRDHRGVAEICEDAWRWQLAASPIEGAQVG